MLMRIVELTDDVTKTTEEHIEEYEDVEIIIKEEEDKKYLEIVGVEKMKGLEIFLDFTEEETQKLLDNMEITKKGEEKSIPL